MKKLLSTLVFSSLIIPGIGHTTVPLRDSAITDPELNSELNGPEALGHPREDMLEDDLIGIERMEERDDSERINYTDRTRTERERKAINTSSNASDDR